MGRTGVGQARGAPAPTYGRTAAARAQAAATIVDRIVERRQD